MTDARVTAREPIPPLWVGAAVAAAVLASVTTGWLTLAKLSTWWLLLPVVTVVLAQGLLVRTVRVLGFLPPRVGVRRLLDVLSSFVLFVLVGILIGTPGSEAVTGLVGEMIFAVAFSAVSRRWMPSRQSW